MKPFQQLLHEAINVQDNPNFWKWFRKSQVVDENKDPLIVYHGSHASIKYFRKTRGAHLGFHFGDLDAANMRLTDTADGRVDEVDRERQRKEADQRFEEWKKFEDGLRARNEQIPDEELLQALDNDEDLGPIFDKYAYKPTEEEQRKLDALKQAYDDSKPLINPVGVGANIGQYYLSAQRLLRMHDVGHWGSAKMIKEHLPFDTDETTVSGIKEDIMSRGYDGIVYANRVENPVMKTDSYIVFEPTQIKSALSNNGNFDPHNPDVTK